MDILGLLQKNLNERACSTIVHKALMIFYRYWLITTNHQ